MNTVANSMLLPYAFIALSLLSTGCLKSGNTAPVAKFSVKKNCMGRTPCEVTFVNESKYAESFQWLFDDGAISVTKDPVHIYTKGNYFIVTLWAIGRDKESVFADTVFVYK
jgi:PKD repeat protein